MRPGPGASATYLRLVAWIDSCLRKAPGKVSPDSEAAAAFVAANMQCAKTAVCALCRTFHDGIQVSELWPSLLVWHEAFASGSRELNSIAL
jgi:hypothetical protein